MQIAKLEKEGKRAEAVKLASAVNWNDMNTIEVIAEMSRKQKSYRNTAGVNPIAAIAAVTGKSKIDRILAARDASLNK